MADYKDYYNSAGYTESQSVRILRLEKRIQELEQLVPKKRYQCTIVRDVTAHSKEEAMKLLNVQPEDLVTVEEYE